MSQLSKGLSHVCAACVLGVGYTPAALLSGRFENLSLVKE
jgi:hypothetical protein